MLFWGLFTVLAGVSFVFWVYRWDFLVMFVGENDVVGYNYCRVFERVVFFRYFWFSVLDVEKESLGK